ncbi:Type I restriction-modification system, specificity subunit S [Methanosarcina siciliae C2J]|uniref:Type I restriction-modification system, specificity subunit S n=1 Tax=Methanosarcina siciliae C2J TaxID=1434118 RepID=A0A0E3PQ49_9EURY|nr:restriction endonuclease subunit S [Methanosarcina siciliae]AKB36709.1 Type I restriction-modification system, specificity subunit S [Methanosarcina siciliae C2J]
MKTIKSLTEAEIAEFPTLPDEWKWARLGELVNDIVVGYVGPITQYLTDDQNNGIRFLSTTHIGENQFLSHKEIRYVTNEFSVNNKKSEVIAGDIIVARHGDSGKCCIIPPYIKKAQVSNAVIIRPNNELFVNLYIMYSFGYLKRHLQKKKVGGVQQVVNTKTMEAFPFPLPPLPEQRAIVFKIEQLFSELDNGIANLKLAQEQLKVYRQAVLKKAFEGELTKKWREQQTDLPNTQNLMEQIRREWEEATKASGKKTKAVKNLTEAELEELSLLPEGWGWVKLGRVVWSVKDGPHYSPKYEENGIPFISGGNVRPSGVDFSNVKYISKELHEELSKRCKPELNDILYTKGGTTGVARVNTYDFDFDVWVHVAVLKTIKSIYPFYLQHVLNSSHCYRQSQKYTHGVGNQDLGLTRMILITLPICSFSEQEVVVQEIETRLSVCDKIEQDIETNLEKAEALRQSILKKAFEGKLLNERELAEVRGAEDWEPAEVLLERIKAERVKNGKSEELL